MLLTLIVLAFINVLLVLIVKTLSVPTNRYDTVINAIIASQIFVFSYYVGVEFFLYRMERLSNTLKFNKVLKITKFLSWFYPKRNDYKYNDILLHQAYSFLVLEQFEEFQNTIQKINHPDFDLQMELYKCILYCAQEKYLDLKDTYGTVKSYLDSNKDLEKINTLFRAIIAYSEEKYEESYRLFKSQVNIRLAFYQKITDKYLAKIDIKK